ncbi:MAG: 2-hydroxychromene-2-carboxylate isomerase [Polyangiaceae bacterium]|jgi:2-hydroxychromene-2-carboxylate isomerase
MTAPRVDFLFDYASPWSYLADATLGRWFSPGQVHYVPVYLRGFESFARGVPYSAAKMAYLLKDMVRSAAHVGVPVTMPPVFPINGLYALRGAIAAEREGRFAEYHAAMFPAAWREGRDVSDKTVVAAIAREVGAAGVAEALDDPSVKDTLRTNTDQGVGRGAFGVPSFFVGEELFWGHDRMHLAGAAAKP